MTTVGDLRASGIKLDPPTSYVSTLPWPFIQEHRGAKNLSHSARERARGCRSYHVVHTSWAAWKWSWLADLQKTPPAPVHLYSNLAALIGFTSYSQVSARSLNPYPTSRVRAKCHATASMFSLVSSNLCRNCCRRLIDPTAMLKSGSFPLDRSRQHQLCYASQGHRPRVCLLREGQVRNRYPTTDRCRCFSEIP